MKFINWPGGHHGHYGPHSAVGTPLPMLIAFMVIGPLGTLFNMLVIAGVLSSRGRGKAYNIYILNVCISDCLISAVYIPYNAWAGMSKDLPTGCLVLGAMYNFLATASIIMLAALALSRYRLIKLPPDRYNVEFSTKRTVGSLLIIWIISIGFLFVTASGTVISGFNHVLGVCVAIPNWSDIMLFEIIQVTAIGIPCYCLIIFSYVSIYYIARAKSNSLGRTKMSRSVRLSRNLFIVTAVYTVCWLPGMLLSFIDSQHTGNDILHQIATMLNLLHCMLNPALYLLLNKGLRNSLCNICRPKQERDSSGTTSTSHDHYKPKYSQVIRPKWLVKLIEMSKLMFEIIILKKRTRSITDSSQNDDKNFSSINILQDKTNVNTDIPNDNKEMTDGKPDSSQDNYESKNDIPAAESESESPIPIIKAEQDEEQQINKSQESQIIRSCLRRRQTIHSCDIAERSNETAEELTSVHGRRYSTVDLRKPEAYDKYVAAKPITKSHSFSS